MSSDKQTATAARLVEAMQVSKVFRDFWGRPKVRAVTDVSFRIGRGRVVGLLGPNGAGKSTLMKLMLGHLYPTGGRLRVFGLDPREVEAKTRLGYLPERANLYRNLTAEETLDFFAEVLELPPAERRSRRDQLLAMVGLERSRKRLVGEFSHGMMRRLGLAQALLNDPDLLLLDEPTAGLDPIGCREVKNLITTLGRRGKTVLMTSHLLADVEDVCDDLLVMFGGQLLADGTVSELLAQKETLQIRMPAPDPGTRDRLAGELSRLVPADQLEFSSPKRNLESYFLELVETASRERETAGAQIGTGVASYLQAGAEDPAQEALADVALEELTHAAHPAPMPETPSAPTVDEAALAALTEEDEEAEEETSGEDIDEGLLDELTGGGSKS